MLQIEMSIVLRVNGVVVVIVRLDDDDVRCGQSRYTETFSQTSERRHTIIMDNLRRSGGVGEVQFCIKCAIKESFYDLVVGC